MSETTNQIPLPTPYQDTEEYWKAAKEHRFIIQWSRLKNMSSNATQNFEMILLDPALINCPTCRLAVSRPSRAFRPTA